MIFKIKRESLEPNVTECIFKQIKPNFYRENSSEAYVYNMKFQIDNTDHIHIFGMPLGVFRLTCGNKTTQLRLQMQSSIRALEVDMNRAQNFNITAPMIPSCILMLAKAS